MTYELRFPPDTRIEVLEYVTNRIESRPEQEAAVIAILAELEKLAANPGLGSSQAVGPFEARMIYRFAWQFRGVTRYLQVAYKVYKKDRVVVVCGFQPVAL
jgi:hypothetical protein